MFVSDATGARDFVYDPEAPWRLATEALSSFYGSRQLASLYETVTSANTGAGGYTGHTLGTVKGRYAGYRVGAAPGPGAYDLELTYGASNAARQAGLVSKRDNGGSAPLSRQFVYGDEPTPGGQASLLVKSLSVIGHAFQVTRTFEQNRDLLTKIETLWSGVSRTRYDYTYNDLRQRRTAVQTGDAFADLGATHQRYAYNSRGELLAGRGYTGGDPESEAGPLSGRLHDYDYDAIGNRKHSNTSGDPAIRDNYSLNDKNQYAQRENNTLTAGGTVTANAAAKVAVSVSAPLPPGGGQVLAGKVGSYWGTNLVVNNQGGPFNGSVTAYAVLPGAGSGGADLFRVENKPGLLPPLVQKFSHDEDGNLSSDGLWDYTWDAENRLASMTATSMAVAVGRPPLTLTFWYDYRHRRVKKEVRSGPTYTLVSERRYLYDGWNVVAELNGSAVIKRSFTWGQDLNGGVGSAGGVGGLLQLHDYEQNKTMFPAYDGNGNVAALIDAATGTVEASYEYTPFGELQRASGAYAQANPFRFGTKWQDAESGLICYGVRYYSPSEGRFLNRDPIEEQGGLNLYGFCGNDAINGVDYLGYSWLSNLWNKARHTIISAVLSVIPGVGPILAAAYNIGVGASYGGVKGALIAAASGSFNLPIGQGVNAAIYPGTYGAGRSGGGGGGSGGVGPGGARSPLVMNWGNADDGYGGGSQPLNIWGWLVGIFVGDGFKKSHGIATASGDERIIADRVGDAIIRNNEGLAKVVAVQDVVIKSTPILGQVVLATQAATGRNIAGQPASRAEAIAALGAGAALGAIWNTGKSVLIGVTQSEADALAVLIQGIKVNGQPAIRSVEAYGSRAGSVYRGRPPLPGSDLDVFVTIDSNVASSPAAMRAILAELDEVTALWNRAHNFKLPLNIESEIDALAAARKAAKEGTPFILLGK